jgi:zinc transporter 9
MGAAFLSGNARLTMIIAAAMVLHKAPMAFGLATYLMACRWTFQRSQRTLLLFSAAAPAATLATYSLLGSLTVLSSPAAVALCVIFSGGTFLHAATMHILPEVLSGGSGHMSGAQLAAVTVGSLLPVALSWGHHH